MFRGKIGIESRCFVGLGEFWTDKGRKLWHVGLRSRTVATQVLAEDPELLKYAAALLIVHLRVGDRLGYRIRAEGCGLKTDAANVEIFLEAIELEEVGEFECADISALCTYFFLQIGKHALQVYSAEAGAEELVPEPFAIEAQAESLSSPVAVKLVEFAYRLRAAFGVLV